MGTNLVLSQRTIFSLMSELTIFSLMARECGEGKREIRRNNPPRHILVVTETRVSKCREIQKIADCFGVAKTDDDVPVFSWLLRLGVLVLDGTKRERGEREKSCQI